MLVGIETQSSPAAAVAILALSNRSWRMVFCIATEYASILDGCSAILRVAYQLVQDDLLRSVLIQDSQGRSLAGSTCPAAASEKAHQDAGRCTPLSCTADGDGPHEAGPRMAAGDGLAEAVRVTRA